jgi:hypothetical protein
MWSATTNSFKIPLVGLVWIDLEASRREHQAHLAGKLKEEPQIPNEHRSPRGMAATHQKAHLLRPVFQHPTTASQREQWRARRQLSSCHPEQIQPELLLSCTEIEDFLSM